MKNLLLVCFLLVSISCTSKHADNNSEEQITVAAAASLTEAFAEMGRKFTAKTGVRVVFSYGATADLTRQIQNGAPFDVFASADTGHVDQLERDGLLTPGSRVVFARGRLVMWLPAGSKLHVTRIEDITAKEFERIAIAKPDVAPYGQAAVEALGALGIWDRIEPKVVYGQNVSQTKQYVSTGNAEVAFIPLALVKPAEGNYLDVDERLYAPINHGMGTIQSSPHQVAAKQFVAFVMSAEGQEILASKGFSKTTPY